MRITIILAALTLIGCSNDGIPTPKELCNHFMAAADAELGDRGFTKAESDQVFATCVAKLESVRKKAEEQNELEMYRFTTSCVMVAKTYSQMTTCAKQ